MLLCDPTECDSLFCFGFDFSPQMCKMETREDRAGWFLGRIMYENDLTCNVTAINVQFFTLSLKIIFLKKLKKKDSLLTGLVQSTTQPGS